nr:immunoglobulin heavy chain junction region [Mus musculus]MBK4196598.1 immunoglobulin heavy chain junction region [Mus musculus]MBK4196600.1 immunoglobulin heavy chain junction region [Mus musculus]MBK4196601.1 immunoglobulin heavy chain junction region [Mus musculus]MBK4196602.1 immunoglobulin heavy chain junction region [Mus musculus]
CAREMVTTGGYFDYW